MLNVRRRPSRIGYEASIILAYSFHIVFAISAIASIFVLDGRGFEQMFYTAIALSLGSAACWSFGRFCSFMLSSVYGLTISRSSSDFGRIFRTIYYFPDVTK
jgi:hypothetical protein